MTKIFNIIFLLVPFFSVAQDAKPHVTVEKIKAVSMIPGEGRELEIILFVGKGLHIQANPASQKNLIATVLTMEETAGFEIKNPVYPPSKPFRLQGADHDIATYDGKVIIKLPVTSEKNLKNGEYLLKGKLRYQACNVSTCFFPASIPVEIPVKSKKSGKGRLIQ